MAITRSTSTVQPSGIHASDPKTTTTSSPKVTGTAKGGGGFTFTDTGGLFGQYGAGGNIGGGGVTGGGVTGTGGGGTGGGGSIGGGGGTTWFSGGGSNIGAGGTIPSVTPLSPAQVQQRFGAKTKMGTVFSGELEALFGTLKEWEAAARPNYDIFTMGLPTNVGEAYMGLEQALESPANQVTEIQVLDPDTARALTTSVGATVYYGIINGAYTRLDATKTGHKELIEQKEILDTYRPFAMARVQDAIDMKNEITLQGIEDTFTRAREEAGRAFKIGMEEKRRAHEAELSVAEVKATGVETRATAQVKGQEDRATLNLKFTRESEESELAHERDLEIMDATLWNKQETIKASTEASKYLNNLAWELDMASTEQKQAFASNQAHLDRLVQLGQMEQTAELQTQSNLLQAEMIDTTRQQQKMDWIMGLMSNPVALYMMKQSGMMGNIGSLGIGAESAVEKILAAIPEESRVNIQGHNAQSDFEQQIASFQAGVTRGMGPEAYTGYVAGTAPYAGGRESRMATGAPTDYSDLITGPTTEEQIAGPDIASDFYQPSAMGNLESIMGRGSKLMEGLESDITQPLDTSAAYRMAMGIEPGMADRFQTSGMAEEIGIEQPVAEKYGSKAVEGKDTGALQWYTDFNLALPSEADFQTTGGNPVQYLMQDAPLQITEAIPTINTREAQEIMRKAYVRASGDEQFGTTGEEQVASAYMILQQWIRSYGVFSYEGMWYDRNKELGRGIQGQQKAAQARNRYKDEGGA